MTKFLFCTDLHYGYERVNGHKRPLHDLRAMNAMLQFAKDFKPEVVILGGDMLDCGAVSHHNHGKPGATEGLKLLADAKELHSALIKPLEALGATKLVYVTGNHEQWLKQLTDLLPSLEGIVDLTSLLKLEKWEVIPQGGQFNLGKLTFLHGDTISGGEHFAKAAVINYERNIRFGHQHTFAAYTKNSPTEYKNAKTGVAVPCLCLKTPAYSKSKPNRWQQGLNFGYVNKDGTFTDYVALIVNGQFIGPNGKLYKG